MLIRYIYLYDIIERYLIEYSPTYLQLSQVKVKQIKYLIDLTKPFCAFTQAIGRTTQPTVQLVFPIYNKLLNYLETAQKQLGFKRALQKAALRSSLQLVEEKLLKYYSKTKGSLGHLYSHVVLLTLHLKCTFFQTNNQGEDQEEIYQNSLQDVLFN